jgi:creatinine amidohydrolase/Fe(II)-dependent formamide hydrolase-like protein
MKIPDTSDTDKMAHIGRMTVLRKARREAAQRLRDRLVPLLNSIEMQDSAWEISGIVELVEEINAINRAIEDIN